LQTVCKLFIHKLVVSGDQQRAVFIESIRPDHRLSGNPVQEEDYWFILEFFNIYPRNVPVYPHIRLQVGELEVDLGSDLPEQAIVVFHALVFTEETVTREQLVVIISRDKAPMQQLTLETLELLKEYAGSKAGRRPLEKFVSRRNLLLPKYMRKVAWRLMIRVMPREVARFFEGSLQLT
jgi:hypothetical protein